MNIQAIGIYNLRREIVPGGYFVPFALYIGNKLIGRYYTEQEARESAERRAAIAKAEGV